MKKKTKRYFGIVKIQKGAKLCWLSHESKNGYSLGLALNSRNVWLRGLRFSDEAEIKRVTKANIVFVHTKKS